MRNQQTTDKGRKQSQRREDTAPHSNSSMARAPEPGPGPEARPRPDSDKESERSPRTAEKSGACYETSQARADHTQADDAAA